MQIIAKKQHLEELRNIFMEILERVILHRFQLQSHLTMF